MKCSRCQGSGYESYDEDGRMVTDACYHCGTTGEVDEETHFHDRLMSVANTLAYQAEREYRQACDNDPEGDGYDLHAAENMMRTSDYFMARVYDRQYSIAEELSKLDQGSQELLVAWNEQPQESLLVRFNRSVQEELRASLPSPNGGKQADVSALFGDDDIPF
jgi:hypothetical protein